MFSGCSPFLLANLGQYGDPSMRVCFQALTTISNECALVPCGLGRCYFLFGSCFCLAVDRGCERRFVHVQAVHRRLAPSTSSAASQFQF